MHRKCSPRFDVVDHFHKLVFCHVPGGVELVELHLEMVYPVMHDLVFEVFLAEGVARAVDEVASVARFDVYELGELVTSKSIGKCALKRLLAIFTKSENGQKKKKRVW